MSQTPARGLLPGFAFALAFLPLLGHAPLVALLASEEQPNEKQREAEKPLLQKKQVIGSSLSPTVA